MHFGGTRLLPAWARERRSTILRIGLGPQANIYAGMPHKLYCTILQSQLFARAPYIAENVPLRFFGC